MPVAHPARKPVLLHVGSDSCHGDRAIAVETSRAVDVANVETVDFVEIPHVDSEGRLQYGREYFRVRDLDSGETWTAGVDSGTCAVIGDAPEGNVATVKVVRDYSTGEIRTFRKGVTTHRPSCRHARLGKVKMLEARVDPWNRTRLPAEIEQVEVVPSYGPVTCKVCGTATEAEAR